MKVTLNRKETLGLLKDLKMVIPSNSRFPIIRTILMVTDNNSLVCSATNLESFITGRINAEVIDPGSICMPVNIIKPLTTIKDDIVTISTDKNKVSISGQKVTMSIDTDVAYADDSPPIPDPVGYCIGVTGLSHTLGKIICSVAIDDTRPVLNGICFDPLANNVMKLVAADGFRLSISQVAISEPVPNNKPFIIPLNSARIINKLFPGDVKLTVEDDRYVSVADDRLKMVISNIIGQFPDYKCLIPEHGQVVTFIAGDLLEAAQTAVASVNSEVLRMVGMSGTEMKVSMVNMGEGDIDISINCNGRVKSGFNVKYIIEMLKTAGKSDTVTMCQTSPTSAAKFDIGDTIHVIMPMFVEW